jgi:hypothetical protein
MRMTTALKHVLTVACLLALCLPAHAQWKWRDKDGRVTASDRPPPREVPDKDIISRPPTWGRAAPRSAAASAAPFANSATSAASAASSASAQAAPPVERELEARKKAAEQDKAAKLKADEERVAAQRADNCKRARAQLTALDSGQRMARVNDKGEREVLDDAARNEELRRTREVMASDCR